MIKPEDLEHVRELPGYDRGHPHYFKDQTLDHLLEITLLLGGEIWSDRDRQMVMEHLLATEGQVTPEMIEQFEPDKKFKEQLQKARLAFIKRVYGCLYGDSPSENDSALFGNITKKD